MESLPSGIQYRHWPVDDAKACVLLAHGLAEHTGRYEHLAARFNERGVAVVGPDHMGHGASPGARVYLKSFSEYLEPMQALRARIDQWYPGRPVFLMGHSMGGLISAHLLLESQAAFQGAMLSGPAFHAVDPAPAPLLWVGRLLKRVLPKLGMVSLDANGVSRDPAVVADYLADPLVYNGKITTGLGIEMLDAMEVAIARAGEITLPIYIAHGDGLGPGDLKYKMIKRIFTNPVCQWLYRRLHPNFGVGFAARMSRASRNSQSDDDHAFLGDKERQLQHSLSVLENENIDFFIYGHRHHLKDLPITRARKDGTKIDSRYVVLGDWISIDSFAKWDGTTLTTSTYSPKQ